MSTTLKMDMGGGIIFDFSADTPEELVKQMNAFQESLTKVEDQVDEKDVTEVILDKIVELTKSLKSDEASSSVEAINVLSSEYQRILSVNV